MIPKNLKNWDHVKNSGSVIVDIENPEWYYYQFNKGTYYPVIEKYHVDSIPEKKEKYKWI
jgi:hypothetical protein